MLKNFQNTIPEEQETNINIDYYESILRIYSSKKSICKRIYQKIGKPNKVFYCKEKVTGAEWSIPFKDKKSITAILSRPTLIGNIK